MIRARTLNSVGCFILAATAAAACGSGSAGPAGPAGPAGEAGATGPQGPGVSTPQSVNGITPAHAFLARKTQVTISGFATNWTKSTTVDFGAGITVNAIDVASPTALVVDITIDKGAALGARDVTVNDGTNKAVYAGGFSLESPVSVKAVGTIAQGSVVSLKATNRDFQTLFDTTSTSSGLFAPPTYTNFGATSADGLNFQTSNVTQLDADVMVLIDVDAPAATQDVTFASGAPGAPDAVLFPAPKSLNVTARSATPLTSGTPLDGNVADPYGSVLYQFTPAAPNANELMVIDFVATGDASASPALALLPKSGKFMDIVGFAAKKTLIASNADPYYAIYWDNSGATGAHKVTATGTSTAAAAAVNTATTKVAAQSLATVPVVVTGATLTTAATEAWFSFTGVVGKKVHVMTDGDPKTDTAVDVLEADGTTSLVSNGPADSGYQENVVSSAMTTATTHYVHITAGTGYLTSHTAYQMLVRLE